MCYYNKIRYVIGRRDICSIRFYSGTLAAAAKSLNPYAQWAHVANDDEEEVAPRVGAIIIIPRSTYRRPVLHSYKIDEIGIRKLAGMTCQFKVVLCMDIRGVEGRQVLQNTGFPSYRHKMSL